MRFIKLVAILFLFFAVTDSLYAKKFVRKTRTLFVENSNHGKENWTKLSYSIDESLKELLELLGRSRTGRLLIKKGKKKASNHGQTLLDVIKIGDKSSSDTTLIRKFYPSRPDRVIYEDRSKIFLNKSLAVIDALLDLAHELTHFSFRKAFNPYQSRFNLKDFITSTVEGKGGEIDAYIVECKVLRELFPKEELNRSNCGLIIDQESGKFSKKLGLIQFYKVGDKLGQIKRDLHKFHITERKFNHLSDGIPSFISSAYGLPYPVAAIKEYSSIMTRVCRNDEKRLAIMKSNIGRRIASRNDSRQKIYRKMKKSFESRCNNF